MNIAVLGCGYWGKNHVRTFRELGTLAAVCDQTPSGQELAGKLAPEVPVYRSFKKMLEESTLDGVVIATPAETHAALAEQALDAGLDVLVEKPLALHVEEAERLVQIADDQQRIVMVGHVLEYHPAFLRLHEIVKQGELGSIRYVYSNRLNLGKIRREENILWSFAPHDISLLLRLVGSLPIEVVATGGNYIQANIADVTVTQLLFDNGVRAHIFVSWLHPLKEQRLVVVGSKKMAVFDDVAKELAILDQHVDWLDGSPQPVKGEKKLIAFGDEEPLRCECRAFLEAIVTRRTPRTNGQTGINVLKVLEAAQRSLVTNGTSVQMPFAGNWSHRANAIAEDMLPVL